MKEIKEVYFDYAATTPLDPRVFKAMEPYFTREFGNPSSIHRYGQVAEGAMETARERIAADLNCKPGEILFTSGGTESDNLAVRGAALARRKKYGTSHILISPVEHHAVSHTALQLANEFGFTLEYLPVDSTGMVDPGDVSRRIRPDTALVSVIFANNEIGTINPIREIGAACREKDVPFHTDAVQAAAHLQVDVRDLNVDLMTIGAHKFYGPKGTGALYRRSGSELIPTQTGGSQEMGLRAGTQNVPYLVGMAEAFHLARLELADRQRALTPIRDHLIGTILEEIPEARLTGHLRERLPNHASFVFKGVDGNSLLIMLDRKEYACSSGSACKTGDPEPSDVLTAVGLERDWALGSLRITLGSATRMDQAEEFLQILPDLVAQARTW